jgi:predicted nucleic acid binding AN1-type Zn finger protein
MNPDIEKEKNKRCKQCTRCNQCKKKLGIMEYTCKCEKQFCISHLQPQEHACTFNYKAEADVALIKHLESEPRASKLEKI